MHERFSTYLRLKKISQAKLARMAGVSPTAVSRFCAGENIASNSFILILRNCPDLNLDWLIFGSGNMLRDKDCSNLNIGTFSGGEIAMNGSVQLKHANGVNVSMPGSNDSRITELEKLISEKDTIISERDATISNLLKKLVLG